MRLPALLLLALAAALAKRERGTREDRLRHLEAHHAHGGSLERADYSKSFPFRLPHTEAHKLSKMKAGAATDYLRSHQNERYLHPTAWAGMSHPGLRSHPAALFGLRSPQGLTSAARQDIMNTKIHQ